MAESWLNVSEDPDKATDRHQNTLWPSVTADFKQRMADLSVAGGISAAVAANAASREQSAIEKYFRRVSTNVTKLMTAFLAVEKAPCTRTLSAEDL